MKKKFYVAMCLSVAMALPGVVSAAQHQENVPSSAYGFVNVKTADTSFAVMYDDKQGDEQKPQKWQAPIPQNQKEQHPDKNNEDKHYDNDKKNPGNHYGHEKENDGKHLGHDQENYEDNNKDDHNK